MYRQPKVIAEFINEYEEKKIVHRDGRGLLRVKQNREMAAFHLTYFVSKAIGSRIRYARKAKGLTMKQLAERAGLTPSKQRMKEIEDCSRNGIRMGTAYALARVLDLEITDLFPTVEEAFEGAAVKIEQVSRLGVG